MEQITEVMSISEVTPKFLEEFAQKTNSFYQTVEQILDDVSECRIRYGVNDSNNTIIFGTLDSEELDDLIKKSNFDLIPGELRVLAGGDLGENLYRELENRLEREFHIDLKSEYLKNQYKGFHEIDGDMAVSMCEHGFNVFENGLDKKLLSLDDFNFDDNKSVYYAPKVEVEQENALCSVVDGLDKLNDLARYEARETESILTGISLEDYATELHEDGDCKYIWRDGRSEWQNIADSILSGDTEYIHAWLNDLSDNLPYFEGNQGVSIDEHIDALTQYEKTYHPNISDLHHKVNAEYNAFIDDMKKQPPEKIIEAAYEITWKDNINEFIENENVLLSHKQLNALLSSKNTLYEVYEEWCQNGDLDSYSDIQTALDDTANHILLALDNAAAITEERTNKPRLSLSERIDKARAENSQNNVPKQDVSQTKKQEQEI